jgi:hypothetical protein
MKKRITDFFRRGMDGRWICTEAATFHHPTKNILFARGAVFGPEDTFMGVKVAKWLDSLVDARRAGLTVRLEPAPIAPTTRQSPPEVP